MAIKVPGFVWAVPKNHVETESERMIKNRAMRIYNEYRARREKYMGENKKGAVELLRD